MATLSRVEGQATSLLQQAQRLQDGSRKQKKLVEQAQLLLPRLKNKATENSRAAAQSAAAAASTQSLVSSIEARFFPPAQNSCSMTKPLVATAGLGFGLGYLSKLGMLGSQAKEAYDRVASAVAPVVGNATAYAGEWLSNATNATVPYLQLARTGFGDFVEFVGNATRTNHFFAAASELGNSTIQALGNWTSYLFTPQNVTAAAAFALANATRNATNATNGTLPYNFTNSTL